MIVLVWIGGPQGISGEMQQVSLANTKFLKHAYE